MQDLQKEMVQRSANKLKAQEDPTDILARVASADIWLSVNLLEEKGIGRPSTFASLIDKIQFRNYVEKKDIEGIEIKNYNYVLKNSRLEENESSIIVGNEKNKLVITSLGVVVIEFIIEKMEELFNYEYTKNMEFELYLIASGNKIWHTSCQS